MSGLGVSLAAILALLFNIFMFILAIVVIVFIFQIHSKVNKMYRAQGSPK